MKKLITPFLMFALCVTLAACGGKDNNTDASSPKGSSDPNGKEITVTVTADNWDEYFEVLDYKYYSTDEFGDFVQAGVEHLIKLKDKYVGISGVPDVFGNERLIEYAFTVERFSVEMDHQNKTFQIKESLGDKTEGTNKTYVKLWDHFSGCHYTEDGGTAEVFPTSENPVNYIASEDIYTIALATIGDVLRVVEFEMTVQVVEE